MTPEDPYTWKYLPDREHLFARNLSKHGIMAYIQLHDEVGVAFEVVPQDPAPAPPTLVAPTFATRRAGF